MSRSRSLLNNGLPSCQPSQTWPLRSAAEQTLGIQNHDRYANEAFDALPGVKHDQDEIVDLVSGGVDKELFYDMDANAHFVDPHILKLWYDWDQDDIDEVATNLGPFFGSFIRRHSCRVSSI